MRPTFPTDVAIEHGVLAGETPRQRIAKCVGHLASYSASNQEKHLTPALGPGTYWIDNRVLVFVILKIATGRRRAASIDRRAGVAARMALALAGRVRCRGGGFDVADSNGSQSGVV